MYVCSLYIQKLLIEFYENLRDCFQRCQKILENKKFIQRKKKPLPSAKFNIKFHKVYTIIYAV